MFGRVGKGRMANILVTGGAGFIGSHLVEKLIELGHKVVILDNLSSGSLDNLHEHFEEFVLRDITQPLDDIFEKYKFEYVFHLAAQINLRESIKNPLKDAEINILGSINLFNLCKKHRVNKLIFSSTGGAIYFEGATLPWTEYSKTEPSSPYGLSKLTTEYYLKLIMKDPKSYCILRYSNVFGPRQNSKSEAGVVSIFIEKILEGENLVIFGNGEQTRDFIYVDDVINANILVMNETLNGTYNVSTGTETSINKISEEVLDAMKSQIHVGYQTAIEGELYYSCLSSEKLQTRFWEPKISLTEGIKRTAAYFKNK